VVYGAGPRMARESNNLAGESKPAAGRRQHMRPAKQRPTLNRVPRLRSRNWLEPMSTDEMIACLGSCQDRSGLAAMIEALSLHPSLNTPVETKRLEAARAAMANWKAYSHACQARHNARRLRLSR
jgi:hypothetical protein